MNWGNQYRYCPNCGKEHYDTRLTTNHVLSMCCDHECREQWQMKYARMIMGKNAEIKTEEAQQEPVNQGDGAGTDWEDPIKEGDFTQEGPEAEI